MICYYNEYFGKVYFIFLFKIYICVLNVILGFVFFIFGCLNVLCFEIVGVDLIIFLGMFIDVVLKFWEWL